MAELAEAGAAEIVGEPAPAEQRRRVQLLVSDPVNLEVAPFGHYFVDPQALDYTTEPVRIYRLPTALLLGSDGIVVYEGAPPRDTVRFFSHWIPECVVAEYVYHTSLRLKHGLSVSGQLASPAFIGFNGAWRNYAHWMQECLPKIIAWKRLRFQLGRPTLVVPRVPAGSFQAETLRLLGIGSEDVAAVSAGEVLALEATYLCSENELWSIPSLVVDAAAELVSAAQEKEPPQARSGDRIYIHREVQARPLANLGVITPVLERNGFSVVSFEDLPLSTQIATMGEARYVLGEHGAGLANVLFCRPGARVLELFNPASVQPAFWSISSACGHEYGYVVGAYASSVARSEADRNSPYEVSPHRLEEAILTILRGQTNPPAIRRPS